MIDLSKPVISLPPDQEAIRAVWFERTRSFVEFTKKEVEQSIPERFEKIARLHRDRIAIKDGEELISYYELNALANRLARTVLAQEERNASPVALLFDKGVGQIAAMLGVLKAGKPFVLLEPSLPAARMTSIFKDSQAAFIVTDRRYSASANQLASAPARIIVLQSIGPELTAENLRLHTSPRALAFLVHTSGSTGEPKGVMWTHRNLLHHVRLRANSDRYCIDDRIPQLSSGTANSITDVFAVLLNGATLLPFNLQKNSVSSLSKWLRQERISVCPIASPLFRKLCEAIRSNDGFPDLRLLRLRSEATSANDVDLYKKHFGSQCVLATGLASSETGLLTEYFINHDAELAGNEVPIGYPADDKEILLLDALGKRCGFSETGEIVVKSAYISPGYWNRPELTATKFKPDPNGRDEQLYFSGDLGLMRPDGCLVHKGRADFRVKIRGYGVETHEVEKALLNHRNIQEAVVVARQNECSEAYLVGYFTAAAGCSLTGSALRTYLRDKLPEYMIPSRIVRLDAFPLTGNGKIDRRSLPDPGSSRPELDTPYVAPLTSCERQLAGIWADVLSVDRVGVQDNFFELGGHSLAATRVISQVIKTFQLELPLEALFQSPTVSEMAVIITAHRATQLDDQGLSRLLAELESLSDDQAEMLVRKASQ